MLAVIRVILMGFALILISVGSIMLCLIRPFHRNNVCHTAFFMGKVAKLLGVDVEIRNQQVVSNIGPCVYIANHQNSYDIFTISGAVMPGTVSVGKKSLKWIPFFGWMYWLTGNILIDRKNTNKAKNTISVTAEKIKEKSLSVWLFPEGTRSNGRGLLPFKSGAFHTALMAQVPIVPICASNLHGLIKLNRWNNGKLIIEFQPPVSIKNKDEIRDVMNHCYDNMLKRINELSEEAGATPVQAVRKKVA